MNGSEIITTSDEAMSYLSSRDEKLARYIELRGAIVRPAMGDIFTSLIRSIVSQQISTAAARTVWKRFLSSIGEITPRSIASIELDQIQSLGVSFRKAGYIKSAADAAIDGSIDFASLKTMSDDEVVRALSSLPGIGVWTAEMMMLFSMRRPDVLSFGDLGIHRGMSRIFGHRLVGASQRVSKKIFEKHRRSWSPFCSAASLYLWDAAGGAGGV